MSTPAQSLPAAAAPPLRGASGRWSGAWLRRQPLTFQATVTVLRSPMGLAGFLVVLLFVALAIFAPFVAPYSPYEQHQRVLLQPPSAQFVLGTDELGRDLLSRVLYGARVSMIVGVLATAIGATLGVTSGLLSGYLGGWVDSVIMRFYDALLAFPGIIIGIGVISVLGPSSINVAYALALGGMPFFARLMRSSVLSEREREYVFAALSIGSGNARIMFRHVLPNTLPPLLVQLSLAMGFAVLAEASLSFLGLGTQPPDPSWGSMLSDSRAYLREAPFYGLWPGLALTILLVALNFLSDALRDALDPRRVR
jgi:ABC-type dipeptide/oligopeptide/nickel transport system permease subunit